MLEMRKDYLLDRWAVISTTREKRPKPGKPGERKDWTRRNLIPEKCPFCPGNEDMTPPTKYSLGEPWQVRVFENKFPAFKPKTRKSKANKPFESRPALGEHEVIVETRDHYLELEEMPKTRSSLVFKVLEERVKHLDERYKYALLIKNRGREAGASLMHSHSQLFAINYIPNKIKEEIQSSEGFFGERGTSIFDWIIEEEREGPRFIYENRHVFVLVPFAPVLNHSVMFISKKAGFPRPALVADAFKKVVSAMDEFLGKGFPYNTFLHYPPSSIPGSEYHYRWHIHLVPRLRPAFGGFELGTGDVIITNSPKESANKIRTRMR